MKNIIIAIGITAIIIGCGAFYGGMKYAQATPSNRSNQAAQFRFNQNGARTGRAGGNFAGGQVVAKDQNSLTVKTQDGSSRIVFIGSAVSVTKSAAGSISDIKLGDDIIVQGSANADGSVNAQSIQIRPAMPSPTQ